MRLGNLKFSPAIALENVALSDQANEALQVTALLDEIVGQKLQTCGIGAGERNVIDWLDERLANDERPDAVDGRPSEWLVFRMRHPAGELRASGTMPVK